LGQQEVQKLVHKALHVQRTLLEKQHLKIALKASARCVMHSANHNCKFPASCAYLSQFYALGSLWGTVYMMSERNVVAVVGKGYNPFAVILGYWEEVLEHISQPLAQLAAEAFKDEVGVGLRYGANLLLLANVMPQDSVEDAKVGSRAIGKVAHHHPICRRKRQQI
jgi:hypothetical protein